MVKTRLRYFSFILFALNKLNLNASADIWISNVLTTLVKVINWSESCLGIYLDLNDIITFTFEGVRVTEYVHHLFAISNDETSSLNKN